jgi:uncharacterized membrane protein YdjX (TVP38/TMEM64 family)
MKYFRKEDITEDPPTTGITQQPKPPEMQSENQKFGWKHLAAFLFAVSVTVLIFLFREQLRELEKLAYVGAFLVMLVGNATVLLPAPGLVIVYSLGSTLNPLLLGLFAGSGAALGELTGYAAGYGGSAVIDNYKLYHSIKKWMNRYGAIVITLMASIPNPIFDLVGVVAGSMRMKWWRFLIAVWIGKIIQSIIIAYAGAFSFSLVEKFLTH